MRGLLMKECVLQQPQQRFSHPAHRRRGNEDDNVSEGISELHRCRRRDGGPHCDKAASHRPERANVKLEYLHPIAVDGQLWIGQHFAHFAKHGIEFALHRPVTALELFQTMIGGGIDVLATEAVISNFPARGQGKMVLVNDAEHATAQLWVRKGKGIHGLKELFGRTITTIAGTTTHAFLDTLPARLRFAT
ncbi:MAG: hypothetical protein ACREX6_08590 [Casimicrobiaceae bacterium]